VSSNAQVLIDQLEYVLSSTQRPDDFNPPGGEKAAPVLVPTEVSCVGLCLR
jgi:hypothetical protein